MRAKKDERISVVEASRRFGLSINYVYNLLRTGRVEATKTDGRWLIDPKALSGRCGKGARSVEQSAQEVSA